MYELVRDLALPPASLLALGAAGLLVARWRRRLGLTLLAGAAAALYVLSTPAAGTALLSVLEAGAGLPAKLDGPAPGAIVVLGADVSRMAPEFGGVSLGPLALQRVRYAATLHRATAAPLLVSGGRIRGTAHSHAGLMRDALVHEFGVPVTWIEDRSPTTLDNARRSAALLQASGVRRIYLVTHGWHMPRAQMVFARQGLGVVPAGTGFTSIGPPGLRFVLPSARALVMSRRALHEFLGRLYYRLRRARVTAAAGAPS